MRETPTGHAALRVLSEHLKREMPSDFEWDYYTVSKPTPCGTQGCAIGLAAELWPDKENLLLRRGLEGRSEFFDIPQEIVHEIFFNACRYYRNVQIRPRQVAELIDYYLENGTLPQHARVQLEAMGVS